MDLKAAYLGVHFSLGKEQSSYTRKRGPEVCWSVRACYQLCLRTEKVEWLGNDKYSYAQTSTLTHGKVDLRHADLGYAGVRGHAIKYAFAWKSAPKVC